MAFLGSPKVIRAAKIVDYILLVLLLLPPTNLLSLLFIMIGSLLTADGQSVRHIAFSPLFLLVQILIFASLVYGVHRSQKSFALWMAFLLLLSAMSVGLYTCIVSTMH